MSPPINQKYNNTPKKTEQTKKNLLYGKTFKSGLMCIDSGGIPD